MSSNTTYYVDINSQYRDVEKYPNPADFAVSFSTNTQTGYFPQGLPISPSGYFEQASIDPDFIDADLRFINCIVEKYQRVNNTIFICGVYDASILDPAPSVKYKDNTIFTFALVGDPNVFNIQLGFFLAKIDIVEDIIPYKVRWSVYTESTTEYTNIYQGASIKFVITNDNNIYLSLTYGNPFNLNIQSENNEISPLINNVQLPYGDNSPSYNTNIYTFLLDFDGNIGLYNGHTWGYHCCSSDTSEMTNILEPCIDNGKNLYLGNTSFTNAYSNCFGSYKGIYTRNGMYSRDFYMYSGANNIPLTMYHYAYYYDEFFSLLNQSVSTGAMWINFNSFTGETNLNYQEFNTPTNITSIGYADYCEANNNLYIVKNYFTSYTGSLYAPTTGGVINSDLPLQYYIYDKTGLQFNYITQTSPGSYNGYMYPHSVSYGNNVYTFGRASLTGSSTLSELYCYKFNTTTNTVSKVATIGFTGANFTNSKVYAVAEASYIYIMCSDFDYFNSTNDNIVNGYVVRFDPATNIAIQYSEYDVLAASITYQNILRKGSEKYLLTSYSSNPDIDFYNITDYSNVVDQYFTKAVPNSLPIPYKRTVDGKTTYFLLSYDDANYNYATFNITDLNNITKLRNYGFAYTFTYIDDEGFSYCPSNGFYPGLYFYSLSYTVPPYFSGMVFFKQKICGEAYLESTQYNQNISSTYTVPTGSNCIDIFNYPYEEHNILSVVSQDYINFYIIDSSVSITYYNQYVLSLANTPTVLKSLKVGNKQWIFICETNNCLVYTINLDASFDVTYIETVSVGWNIFDINIIEINGVLTLILYNTSCDMNVYQYSTTFNFISTYNFSTGLYTSYANSFAYYKENENSYYLLLNINTTPLTNAAFSYVLDINDLLNIFVFVDGVIPISTGQGYKSTSTISFNGLLLQSNYFSNSNLSSGVTIIETGISPSFFSFAGAIGTINVGDYNGTPCSSYFTINNRLYLACNRSNPGNPKEYLACYFITPSIYRAGADNIFYYTVELESICIDLRTITVGSKTFSISLLDNNKIYLYDLSDPEFAGKNQQLTQTTKVYTNEDFFTQISTPSSSSFIYKINADGSPSWATYIGATTTSEENLGFNIRINSMIMDSSQQNIYVSGNFNTRVQTYNYTSTGFYKSQQITNSNYNLDPNGFLQKLSVSNGNAVYMIPHLGTNASLIRNVKHISTDNSIVICGDFTSNISSFYSPQPAGTFTNPTNIQKELYRSSLRTGYLIKFNNNGVLQWSNLLYTDDVAKNIFTYYLSVDNTKITVLGNSSANTMKSIDNNGSISQTLYSSSSSNLYFYCFNLNSTYIQSNLIQYVGTLTTNDIGFIDTYNFQNKSNNEIILLGNFAFSSASSTIKEYNKDGTLANTTNVLDSLGANSSTVIKYKYDSTYYDTNGLPYSQIVFNKDTPYTFTGGYFENYYIYIGGNINSTGINKSFTIRNNFTGPNNKPSVILNTNINIPSIDRYFENINDIPGSNNYYFTNLCKSPLTSIIEYDLTNVNTGTNQITVLKSLSSFDPNQFYYITYPCEGTTKIIPVTNIQPIGDGVYTFTLEYVNNLECPTGGSYYGPYLYLSSFNQSLYYNLQFFPGSIAQPVYFNVRLQSLTIPNRPLLNLSDIYGGTRSINDLPFIYLSVYNVDDNDNYDDQLVNVVYDSTPLNVKPYPIFQIPVSNQSSTNNFATFSSDIQPVVKFSPGYYNLRIRLFDMNGNPIIFDTSSTKASDYTFSGGIVPTYLTNIYLRMAFTKR